MWTSYNPDAANMKLEEDKGALNVYYPEGNQHHMWHKPAARQRWMELRISYISEFEIFLGRVQS
jgi:hypothetical protein